MGHETSTEDEDHDGGEQSDHEAREEHYKADDASSAVTHDTQNISTETEKISSEKSNENSVTNDLELEKKSNNIDTNVVNGDKTNSKSELGGVTADNDPPLNVTAGEKKDDDIINAEDLSTKHATFVSVSNDQAELSNTSIDVNVEAGNNTARGSTKTSGSSQNNGTLVTSDSNQVNSTMDSGNRETDSNSSIPDKTENGDMGAADSNSSTKSEPAGSDKVVKPEVTTEAQVKSDGSDKIIKPEPEVKTEAEVNSGSSSTTKETADAAKDENSDVKNESGGAGGDSSATDGTEAVVQDHIDSSDSSVGQEEKQARINLDTLPENSGVGVNSRDAAAE
ncbi:hypothetical protein GH714_030561 [Hevea brasiliensis]|uniref:Uncharacterized protein n=1 Tax=Hevea brasiliensis TaxID=3981 RepID=A0A6A6N8F3_HEVBR|nr:hypothetical protein GH714_030561 [Hevea brasiliensis]